MHQSIKFIYFGMTLYMFRTAFPSIVRSSRLYIQQQIFVKQMLLYANCLQRIRAELVWFGCGRTKQVPL